ncbi:hypothetical protein I203_104669 [Kwoniella mangroviensis CBS 8507]|uniref:uncharacterized protein n=1 Tax=Kwoniella mangroviensis CBS 8507 TaxID=1296122 RepID=UPI00080D3873|nr:uncharacterized protein I203_00385 [Kwoniella mangroviensis CBS 8507]OCF70253.1 hypothetical protein I203_00385 [Kwoniella mangroviensis CBS 8507]
MSPIRRSAKSNKTNTSSSSSSSSAQAGSSASSMDGFPRTFDETTILRNALLETERKAIILEGQLAIKEEEYTKLFQETTQLDERLKQFSSRVNDIEESEKLKSTIKNKEGEIRRLKMEHINCQVMIDKQFSDPDSDLFLLHRKELLDELKSLKENNNQLKEQLKSLDEELSNQIAINISTQDQIDDLSVVKTQYEELKVKFDDLQKSKTRTKYEDEESRKMKRDLLFANNRNIELKERLNETEEQKKKVEDSKEKLEGKLAKIREMLCDDMPEGEKDDTSRPDDGSEMVKVREEGEGSGGSGAGSKDRKGKKRASEIDAGDTDSKRSRAASGGKAKAEGKI